MQNGRDTSAADRGRLHDGGVVDRGDRLHPPPGTTDASRVAGASSTTHSSSALARRAARTVDTSTTVLETISRSPANVRTSGRVVVAGGHAPGARTSWRSGRRKARGAGGESLARSAARYAYAAIHNAP